ncbi:MAG TPA: alcohol acetyltransferase [Firmicutes bacterium]|nr:alcohol acetyltransferase [Bacillota bacterium]
MAVKNERPAGAPEWYRLDNSALIYPAVMRRNWAAMFRVSVTLTETIRPDVLQQALEDTVRRMPTFRLSLRRGLFWYYLDLNEPMPRVEPDVLNPCKKIDKGENGGYCFRVRYYRERIALELFHSISDGTGAMVFLKTLAARYLTLRGHPIPAGEGVLDCGEEPRREEMEDSHLKHAHFQRIESRRESAAYHPAMTREPVHTLSVITGRMPVEQVHERAGALGVTINEYLAGALCYAFCRLQKKELAGKKQRPKPVKISVPINMRSFYPSETVRNFSLFVNPGVDPSYGDYSFEETVLQIHHFMRLRLNEKYLNAVLSANVGNQKNAAARLAPLFLKNWAMDIGYRLYGESRYTVSLSNLGVMKAPAAMAPYIRRFDFIMGPPRTNTHGSTAVSWDGVLNLTVASVVEETEAERLLFTELVRRGIHVLVESNRNPY